MAPSKEPSSIFQPIPSATKSFDLTTAQKPALTHYLRNHQEYFALSLGGPMGTSPKMCCWEKWAHPLIVCLDLFHLLIKPSFPLSNDYLYSGWMAGHKSSVRNGCCQSVLQPWKRISPFTVLKKPLSVLSCLLRPNPNIFLGLKGSSFQIYDIDGTVPRGLRVLLFLKSISF